MKDFEKIGTAEETLDSFSKILVATSAINYMANTLYKTSLELNLLMLQRPEDAHIFAHSEKRQSEVLEKSIEHLSKIMESMGNCLNDCDAIVHIDQVVTSPAFDIVVHGNDKTD